MGGTISITLRKSDGTEYRMQRWTNIMPYYLSHPKLYEENEDHISEFLKKWIDMRQDYEKHKDDKKFEIKGTDEYFPSDGMVPIGYGIVVIDMKNKVILDCFQDYHSIGKLSCIKLISMLNNKFSNLHTDEIDEYRYLISSHRIKNAVDYVKKGEKFIIKNYPIPNTFEELMQFSQDHQYNGDFKIDTKPYTIERYEYGDTEKVLNRIRSLGFSLSEEEEKSWKKSIKLSKEIEDD